MANEIIALLSRRNRVGITNAEFQVFDADGATLVTLGATEVAGQAVYRASMPAATPLGTYAWRLQRADNDQPLAFGAIYWDGAQRVTESELASIVRIEPRLTALDDAISDAATTDQLLQVGSDIITAITTGAGLTASQMNILTFLRDVAEADEVYTPTKAQKLLKGTGTVLVDKDVTSNTECEVQTQLIEAT